MKTLSESPKEAVSSYINSLSVDYYKWYDEQKNRNKRWWSILNFLIIGASVITTIMAALQTSEIGFIKNNITVIQVLLVLIPLIGTAASAVLMQTKALELYNLREKGREEIQYLLDDGKRRYAACNTDEEYSKLHEYLVNEVRKVEQSQASDFFNTAGNNS
ncbi:hypothetical protein ACMXYR_09280 [Neptuniibacter sp. QD29_5]|uniref:hypothetical protein n=1 Tax=Neptuniibacter sp. QD29_5 TaxID=3398207 RepID=UPI0039F4D15C